MTKSGIRDVAKMIDHSVLHPAFTNNDLERECEVAKKYDVASVCVKPYAVKDAARILAGSDVEVGCVVGFPHGNSCIGVKVFEAGQACVDGATEIDMVINIGKALSAEWEYLEDEIKQVTDICHKHGAIVKVIFETDYVTRAEDKIKLCEICTKVGADFVKTSTGFGFVKQANGDYNYTGATIEDIKLMRKHSGADVRVKCSGGVRTFKDMMDMRAAGAVRSGATATEAIIEAAIKELGSCCG